VLAGRDCRRERELALFPESGMSTSFAHSSHMPCPDCGASVAAGEQEAHTCDPERRLDYQVFQLRNDVADFDEALAGYLESPEGQFAQWLAERDRPL